MKILIACEFSGVVRDAFRRKGHNAWSCDLEPSGSSRFHLCGDVLNILTKDWDMMIAHPPCTYISNMSNCRIKEPGRVEKRAEGLAFFMKLINAPINKICVENPRGLPEREYRRADQIIQPFEYGHPASKATCLWLKNLPLLKPTNIVDPIKKWDGKRWRTWVDIMPEHTGRARSITFEGIAQAMADQWGLN